MIIAIENEDNNVVIVTSRDIKTYSISHYNLEELLIWIWSVTGWGALEEAVQLAWNDENLYEDEDVRKLKTLRYILMAYQDGRLKIDILDLYKKIIEDQKRKGVI